MQNKKVSTLNNHSTTPNIMSKHLSRWITCPRMVVNKSSTALSKKVTIKSKVRLVGPPLSTIICVVGVGQLNGGNTLRVENKVVADAEVSYNGYGNSTNNHGWLMSNSPKTAQHLQNGPNGISLQNRNVPDWLRDYYSSGGVMMADSQHQEMGKLSEEKRRSLKDKSIVGHNSFTNINNKGRHSELSDEEKWDLIAQKLGEALKEFDALKFLEEDLLGTLTKSDSFLGLLCGKPPSNRTFELPISPQQLKYLLDIAKDKPLMARLKIMSPEIGNQLEYISDLLTNNKPLMDILEHVPHMSPIMIWGRRKQFGARTESPRGKAPPTWQSIIKAKEVKEIGRTKINVISRPSSAPLQGNPQVLQKERQLLEEKNEKSSLRGIEEEKRREEQRRIEKHQELLLKDIRENGRKRLKAVNEVQSASRDFSRRNVFGSNDMTIESTQKTNPHYLISNTDNYSNNNNTINARQLDAGNWKENSLLFRENSDAIKKGRSNVTVGGDHNFFVPDEQKLASKGDTLNVQSAMTSLKDDLEILTEDDSFLDLLCGEPPSNLRFEPTISPQMIKYFLTVMKDKSHTSSIKEKSPKTSDQLESLSTLLSNNKPLMDILEHVPPEPLKGKAPLTWQTAISAQ